MVPQVGDGEGSWDESPPTEAPGVRALSDLQSSLVSRDSLRYYFCEATYGLKEAIGSAAFVKGVFGYSISLQAVATLLYLK